MRRIMNHLTMVSLIVFVSIESCFGAVSMTITTPTPSTVLRTSTQVAVNGNISWIPFTDPTPNGVIVSVYNGAGGFVGSWNGTVGTGGGSVGYQAQTQMSAFPGTAKFDCQALNNGNPIASISQTNTLTY